MEVRGAELRRVAHEDADGPRELGNSEKRESLHPAIGRHNVAHRRNEVAKGE